MAVHAFLNNRIKFTDIHHVIQSTLSQMPLHEVNAIDDVLTADAQAREVATQTVEEQTRQLA